MTKYSISLPDELAKQVSDRYPDTPFSAAIAKILRKGLDIDTTNATVPTIPTIPPILDIADMVRDMVQAELQKSHTISTPVIVDTPVILTAPHSDTEWLTNAQVSDMLSNSIPRGTRSSSVSRAITAGKLQTNGQPKRNCRILKSSALNWIEAQ